MVLSRKRLVRQRLVLGLERVDPLDQRPQLLDFAFGGVAADLDSQLNISGQWSRARILSLILTSVGQLLLSGDQTGAPNSAPTDSPGMDARDRLAQQQRHRQHGHVRQPLAAAADRTVSVTMISWIGRVAQPLDRWPGQQRVGARGVDHPRAGLARRSRRRRRSSRPCRSRRRSRSPTCRARRRSRPATRCGCCCRAAASRRTPPMRRSCRRSCGRAWRSPGRRPRPPGSISSMPIT